MTRHAYDPTDLAVKTGHPQNVQELEQRYKNPRSLFDNLPKTQYF